jgi:hypothetical protein
MGHRRETHMEVVHRISTLAGSDALDISQQAGVIPVVAISLVSPVYAQTGATQPLECSL